MEDSIAGKIVNDITKINIKRIFLSSLFAVPLSFAHVIIFAFNLHSGNEVEYKWRMGIIICHFVFAIIMFALGILSYFSKKRDSVKYLDNVIQYLSFVSIFAIGTAITFFDQLVTVSITPFLLCSIVVGLLFLIRPKISALLYTITYIIYYFTISFVQMDQSILLSIRVNGLTAVGIGFFISLLMWKNSISNLEQKQLILMQETKLINNNRDLKRLAYYDQITGVYNRRKFDDLLSRELLMMKTYKYPSCLVILDIDRFKEINDNFGHPVGDKIIKELATLLEKNIRETDVISRWGGDEFSILLSHASEENGKEITENLRQLVENMVIEQKQTKIKITCSFGVVALAVDEENSYERAYIKADRALYKAKHKGRNRVEVFTGKK